ncbi:carbohydrate ABC transporter permease [Streptomyces europaeiscabiei]|uniref:carbohydrate ABC transporter permease n=1 Tax=Streptomyces europaeiscabiei TaxID=146819 RepID=UPI0029A2EFA0|nr:carbohydrate ABC transporter permease [Streptomyces europaeiscabiei]MDX2527301.1 carbohydrate ABC transporter permease [Streptomyces europaeiscabiei]
MSAATAETAPTAETATETAAGPAARGAATTTRRRRPPRLRTVVLAAVGWLVALTFLAPYLQMLLTALKPTPELMKSPPSYLPSQWKWSNFADVWSLKDPPVSDALWFSLYVAGMSTLLTLAVGLPAAYYTARNRFRGRGAFLLLVLATQMFAPTALLVGIYREMVSLDLTDTAEGLILVNAAFNLPFCIWILNAYFATIPKELEEAAYMDGAGRLGTLVRVTLPLALPGVVTALVYTFIGAWNEYVVALTITSSGDRTTLTKAIPGFVTAYQEQWQYLFATSLIAIVPVVVLFVFVERYLISGLTAGGIK